ncbi:MAG: PQQ-binding-like beta-propeller repeat protein [bacterium]|nr:PQQ-binding-like beta-propeller repeat protein [bacterium]
MRRSTYALTTIVLAGTLAAQEWPRFRGPAGQGHGTVDLPAKLASANVHWRVPAGRGHSSPVLWGSRLFLTRLGTIGAEHEAGMREIACFDADTGRELWSRTRPFDSHDQHKLNSFASATPTADDRGVYVLWTSGKQLVATAFDHDGKALWRRELGEFYSNHGSAMSPVMHGDLVLVANENQGTDCFLTALDRATGEPRWRVERQKSARWASYSPPFRWQPGQGEPIVLLASSTHGLTAIEPATGKLRWQANPGFKMRFIAAPARSGNRLLVNTGSGKSGKECVVFDLGEDATSEPEVAYRPRRGLPYVPSAIALNGRFHWFTDSGFAVCIDAATGDELWRERTASRFFSSPVTNGKHLWVGDRDGNLLAFSPQTFEQLGGLDLGSPIFATPALARGAMFVRTETELVRLGPVRKQ